MFIILSEVVLFCYLFFSPLLCNHLSSLDVGEEYVESEVPREWEEGSLLDAKALSGVRVASLSKRRLL